MAGLRTYSCKRPPRAVTRDGVRMNLSTRSRHSLCQFLTLFERVTVVILLAKFEFPIRKIEYGPYELAVRDVVLQASDLQLGNLIQELERTHDSMRNEVSPRYNFDERWEDFCLCLEIDGYIRERKEEGGGWFGEGPTITLGKFVPAEPMVEGAAPVEDDLTRELKRSGLSERNEILRVLDNSAESFRKGDFNGCLSNSRVALQTLAMSVAQARRRSVPGNFDLEKWGTVIAYLKKSDFITQRQEKRGYQRPLWKK